MFFQQLNVQQCLPQGMYLADVIRALVQSADTSVTWDTSPTRVYHY